jgi:hypothetical protein
LQAARRALVKDRTAALNRDKNLTLALLKRQSQQRLKQIQAQIEAIEREQAALVAKQERLKPRFDILLSGSRFCSVSRCGPSSSSGLTSTCQRGVIGRRHHDSLSPKCLSGDPFFAGQI